MNPTPKNSLEALLAMAADEPAHRPECYRVLLESDVYVISDLDQESPGHGSSATDGAISILTVCAEDGQTIIPFFTSIKALSRFTDDPAHWVSINARNLFILTRGSTLVLNPQSRYAQPFYPGMVEALLATGIHHAGQQVTAQAQDIVCIRPPDPYPAKMVDSLIILFAARPEVTTAWVALKQGAEDRRPNLLVCIDASEDSKQIILEAGSVALDTVQDGQPKVTFVDMNHLPEKVSKMMLRHGQVFYEKRWGARLTDQAGRA